MYSMQQYRIPKRIKGRQKSKLTLNLNPTYRIRTCSYGLAIDTYLKGRPRNFSYGNILLYRNSHLFHVVSVFLLASLFLMFTASLLLMLTVQLISTLRSIFTLL
jgi:hypothetical protein